MDKQSLRFLEAFCNSPGPSGFERAPTMLMKEYVAPYSTHLCLDKMGSLIFEKKGTSESPTILLPGHIDEVGFIVTSISEEGYMTFNQLGGWFDQVLLGQRVEIMSRKGLVKGVIAAKPPHVLDLEERKKVVTKDNMFIDIGCTSKKEVEAMGVRIGDGVVPDSRFFSVKRESYEDGKASGERDILFGKAFDDRIGAFIAAEAVRYLVQKKVKHPNRVMGAATTQEEVGLRGARTVAQMILPDVAIVLDVDIAGDVPGIKPSEAPARMGKGVSITTFDASMVPNQGLKELSIALCEKFQIPYQLSHAKGGTDAGPIHMSNIGVPSIVLGVATRHIHSHVGIVDALDIESAIKLTVELIKELDSRTVDEFTSFGGVKCSLSD